MITAFYLSLFVTLVFIVIFTEIDCPKEINASVQKPQNLNLD